MSELKDFKIIVATTQNLTKTFLVKGLFLYMVFYCYAFVGMKVFGGQINRESVHKYSPDSPVFYYLLNFNTFTASLITLFHFMVINNWYVTIDMY